jgi:copper transport protein
MSFDRSKAGLGVPAGWQPQKPVGPPRRAPLARRRGGLLALTFAACSLWAMLGGCSSAWAHAQLLGTSPVSGTTVQVQPRQVIFEFNQNVGGTAGAVRVYDAAGRQVDDLHVTHPDGNERWIGVGLRPHLPDGTYTATYRVISADTHIVYGGLVFDIGHAGAAPRFTVTGLIGRERSGHVTQVAFGLVRALDYLTLALMVGGLVFLLAVWRPALAAVASSEQRFSSAREAVERRLRALFTLAVALGLSVSVLGVLLQGADSSGVSLWSSLKRPIVEGTLESRFGWVWAVRALVWLLIGVLLLAGRRRLWSARGVEPPRASGAARLLIAALLACCAYLLLTPALAGHASVESPSGVFFPADVIHVLAASVWVGGVACLLVALPAGTRQLQGAERTGLLLATLERFSPLALAAVVAIAVTGVVQAYIDVRSLHALLHTVYGGLILAKTALLAVLIGFGWVNRERVIPLLRRLAAGGSTPGAAGIRARRTMRGELALMGAVLGVTAALIGYAPPVDMAAGPFSTSTRLGPAELEMTLEPARVGANTIHLYLIDARTGAQFTATKELTASARLPAKGIGPLPLRSYLAGPGHYVFSSAVLSPGGTWLIEIVDRVSEFQQYSRVVKVPIG